jgi:hypothetical protein
VTCGLIQANRIWEVSTSYKPEATKSSNIIELDMLCSEFNIDIKKEIEKNYLSLLRANLFKNKSMAERICSVTYFTLQDNNKIVNVRELCKFLGCNVNSVFKLSKRISKHFSKVGIFILSDLEEYYKLFTEDETRKVKFTLKELSTDMTLTRGIISAVMYEYSSKTQNEICDIFGVSLPRLKRNLKKVREYE